MDENPKLLLTSDEVDAFLLKMRKSPCAWCGSKNWGMHSDDDTKETGLRSFPRIHLTQDAAGLRGTVSLGTNEALVVAMAECMDCHHLEAFNYFAILNKVRAEQAAEKDNEQTSSN
ncbi:hypothetical protein [Comamonas suwonensis]|uniref:Uncharacterized protein n=1 Tax=Comamonas suwonensis TaxID=2606214 RepID=A0A843B5Q5_9BURK|nr:hypothetical protein [Comamonas suwonensis]MBI1626023.1 hypothetical protein [Comamonas suwonensis]